MVIELTSRSTKEDLEDEFALYRDELKVREFDPNAEYLSPRLQGFRLRRSKYLPIAPVPGRLPSTVVNLHLEAHEQALRLYDPAAGRWLPTPTEALAEAAAALQAARAENQRLQIELDASRRGLNERR